jgi:hypothetical protein
MVVDRNVTSWIERDCVFFENAPEELDDEAVQSLGVAVSVEDRGDDLCLRSGNEARLRRPDSAPRAGDTGACGGLPSTTVEAVQERIGSLTVMCPSNSSSDINVAAPILKVTTDDTES